MLKTDCYNAVISTPPPIEHSAEPVTHSPKQRIFDYDFIRFIAICFVLSVHASWMTYNTYTPLQSAYADTMRSIFLTCNGLFFLLAGKFALSKQACENITIFYAKKFSALVIPMVIIGFIRTVNAALYSIKYSTSIRVDMDFPRHQRIVFFLILHWCNI